MEIKVLRTSAKEAEMCEKMEKPYIHLYMAYLSGCKNREMGDVLSESADNNSRFAFIVKEDINSKIITSSLRLSIISLFKHMIESDIDFPEAIIISRHQFHGTKEETTFICTIKELCMTYFSEVVKDKLDIIMTDYPQE